MAWLAFVSAALSLVQEILKYLEEQEITKRENTKEKTKRITAMTENIRKARETNDTSSIEEALRSLGFKRDVPANELQDDETTKYMGA
jgi:hypothetical protein